MEWYTFERQLGETIKRMREDKGITQEKMASDLEIKRETVKQWENAERYIKAKNLLKIADYLDVSTDELLGREKEYSDIPPDTGAVLQQCGLPVSLFRHIKTFSDEQKAAIRLLFSSRAFPQFLDAVLRCSVAYQKEQDLVLRAEAQRGKDFMEILAEIPATQRIDMAGMLYGYRSLCQYVMDSADDEANHAVTNLQETAAEIGRDLVKKSKAQANKKSVEDWQKEQDALIERFIETLREEAPTDGNDHQT